MIHSKTTIFSPDSALTERLRSALGDAGLDDEAHILEGPPTSNEVYQAVGGDDTVPLVFVDMAQEDAALRVIQQGHEVNPEAVMIAANGSRQLSSLVRAKEAGAWGYLVEPIDLRPLAEHLGAASAAIERVHRLVSFLPAQGGNGTSTVALHVATSVASELGSSTLLMDWDFHSGAIAFQLGIESEHSIAGALENPPSGSNDWSRLTCGWEELDVLIGPPDPDEAMRASRNTEKLLDAALEHYCCVIADLPGPVDSSSARILERSDCIYIVCTPEIKSLHIAKRKAERMRRIGVADKRVHLLVNRSSSRGALDAERAGKIVGLPVDWTLENDYQAVRAAAWKGGVVPAETKLGSQMRHLGVQIIEELEIRKPEAIAA